MFQIFFKIGFLHKEISFFQNVFLLLNILLKIFRLMVLEPVKTIKIFYFSIFSLEQQKNLIIALKNLKIEILNISVILLCYKKLL